MKKLYILISISLIGYQMNTNSLNAQTISANWKATGPITFPILDKSSQINGIGRVQQIVFHATDPNKMYAVSASGGLFITTDGAKTWKVSGTDKLPGMKCASLCVDYTNDKIMYLGSGDATYHFNSLGVWKSTDGGVTWKTSNTGMGTRLAVDILMDPANNNTLIAATSDGIWKSTNAGANWTVKKSGSVFNNMRFNPADPKIIYAIASNEFYRSADMGDSWTKISLPGNGNTVEGRIGVSKADANVVYITFVGDFTSNPKTCTPVLKSTNAGQSFVVTKPAGIPNLAGYSENETGWGWWEYTMTVDPLNANNVWVGCHVVYNSKDGGVTWKRLTSWPVEMHTDFHHMIYSPHDPTKLYNANDGGVWVNMDGGLGTKWKPISDGLSCTENYTCGQSPIKNDRMATGTQDNGELYYNNMKWYTSQGGDSQNQFAFDAQNANWIYNITNGTRKTVVSGGSYSSYGFTAGSPLEFTKLKPTVAFGYNTDISRTDNLTAGTPTWKKISSIGETIKGICISPDNADVVYCVTTSGKVYRSTNALGATPTFTNISTAPSSTSTKGCIALIHNDPNVVYLGAGSKVYRSSDKGVTWVSVTGTLPSLNMLNMFHDVYSIDESVYVANGTGGVYYKNKKLTDWVPYSQGLPTIAPARTFMIFNDGNYNNSVLRISFFGRGVFETTLYNSTTGINTVAGNDNILKLFPNPSKGAVNISFILSQTANTGLEIYDMSGKIVKVIITTRQLNPGEYNYPIDISSLEPGAYACRLNVDGIVSSKIVVRE
jgi:hypothetical protein